jgi:hypothetical protein
LDTLSRCEEVVVDLLHRACRTLSSPATSSGPLATAGAHPDYLISTSRFTKSNQSSKTVAPPQSLRSSTRPSPTAQPKFCPQGFRYLSFTILSGCRSTRLAVQNVQPRPASAFSLLEFACRPFHPCRAQKGHLAGISQAGDAGLVE